MSITTIAAGMMCWTLRSEVSYATSTSDPVAIGDLASLDLSSIQPNQYVEARGTLESQDILHYSRPLERDSFRLQRVTGSSSVWVESRVPAGMDSSRFVPPSTFAGRLVPFSNSGLRHTGVAQAMIDHTGTTMPTNAWLLVDGVSPRTSQWILAFFVFFGCFAVWNAVNVVRVLRPVR